MPCPSITWRSSRSRLHSRIPTSSGRFIDCCGRRGNAFPLPSNGQDPISSGIDLLPYGVDALRPSLAVAIDYAFEQGLMDRRLEVDELFDDTTRAL